MMKKTLYILLVTLTALQAACTQSSDLYDSANGKARHLADYDQDITVINLWASWCAPCREEMPELAAFARELQQQQHPRKINVIGIAFDQEENIKTFLKTTPVNYPVWRYAGTDSAALMASLGNQAGALPYTVISAPACDFKQPFYGKIDKTQLNAAVAAAEKACSGG